MDPPWYKEHFKAFLWVASKMCVIGGHLLVSMPPLGTRPAIQIENEEVIKWASMLGLRLIKIEKATLPYISPPFERNALKAEGISAFSIDWRRGDLAIFILENHHDIDRPIMEAQNTEWQEVIIDDVRVRVRVKQKKSGVFWVPNLKSLVPGDILSTVSNRNKLRRLVDVWTSVQSLCL